MKLLLALMLLVAVPTHGQQPLRAQPPPQSRVPSAANMPALSVWGRSQEHMQNAFDGIARRIGLRLRMSAVFCEVQPVMTCETDVGGITVKFLVTEDMRDVREMALVMPAGASSMMVNAIALMLIEMAEPSADTALRREAVLSVLGRGEGPTQPQSAVSGTTVVTPPGFRAPSYLVLRPMAAN